MKLHGFVMAAVSVLFVGCGGSGGGGGSRGPDEALFAGPLMFIGTQMRIYNDSNLQLADFNNDDLPELYYEGYYDVLHQSDYEQLILAQGSETEIFSESKPVAVGYRTAISDFDGDGNLDMFTFLIFGSDRGGSETYDWCFLHGNGDNTFADPVLLGLAETVGTYIDVAKADINGDGFEDLLSQGYAEAAVLPIVSRGDGTFEPAPLVELPESFEYVEGAALNNDSFDDMIVALKDDIYTALSNGDGTFSELQLVLTTDAYVVPFMIADVNGDGLEDMVGAADEGITVFLSDGDGTFTAVVSDGLPLPFAGQVHAIADFNDDQNTDVVFSTEQIVRGETLEQLYVALGNGDGTFGPDAQLLDEGDFRNAVTTDADRDGNLDLLIAVSDRALFLRPYFGNGDGTFREESSTLIEMDPAGNLLTNIPLPGKTTTQPFDVDDDGNLDLVIRNSNASGDLSLLLGNGNGTFAAEQRIPLAGVRIQQTADLDDDGLVDFFGQTMTRFFGILRNYGGGSLQPLPLIPVTLTTTPGFGFEGAFDLDADDLLDPLFWFDGGDLRVLYNLGDMQFEPLVAVANIGEEALRAVADITGDGYVDLVTELGGEDDPVHQFFVRAGGPGRTFGSPVMSEISRPTGPSAVLILGSFLYDTADFNGDGRADLVLVRDQVRRTVVSLLHGQANGTLMPIQDSLAPWAGFPTAQIADLELDGDPDLVVESVVLDDLNNFLGPHRLVVSPFLTNDSGQLEPGAGIPALAGDILGDFDFAVVDVTGDDFPDALVYSDSVGLMVAVGQGDGTFGQPNYFRTGGGTRPAIGDFDNDGDAEFVAETAAGGVIEILENRFND